MGILSRGCLANADTNLSASTLQDLANGLAINSKECMDGMSLRAFSETIEAYRDNPQTAKGEAALIQHLSDLDGTGFVGPEVLQRAFALLGMDASEAEAKEIIREVGRNSDGIGEISSEDFMRLMSK